MALSAAIMAAKSSAIKESIKEISKVGEKILSELFACKIKPKGTPHMEVFNKAPKFFGSYGVYYSTDGRQAPSGNLSGLVFFDLITGYIYSTQQEVDAVFPVAERKKVEATLRKKCESVTGNIAFYVQEFPLHADKGVVRLSDGNVYDGRTYTLEGGSRNSPKEYSQVERKRLPHEINNSGESAETTQKRTTANLLPLALLAVPFLIRKS